jgi:hypothetical protein
MVEALLHLYTPRRYVDLVVIYCKSTLNSITNGLLL